MTRVAQFYADNVWDINKQLDRLGLDSKDIITILKGDCIAYQIFYHREIKSCEDSSTS